MKRYGFLPLLLLLAVIYLIWDGTRAPDSVDPNPTAADFAAAEDHGETETDAADFTDGAASPARTVTSPSEADPNSSSSLTVKIITADGDPVSDCAVYWVDASQVNQEQVDHADESWAHGPSVLLRENGHQRSTDGAGVVHIPKPMDFRMLLAEKGDQFAFVDNLPLDRDEVTYKMRLNRKLLVRTLDQAGNPAANQRVVVKADSPQITHNFFYLISNDAGELLIEDLDSVMGSGPPDAKKYVELAMPFDSQTATGTPRVQITEDVLTLGKAILQKPSTGQLTVNVIDATGAKYLGEGKVELHHRDGSYLMESKSLITAPLSQGTAHFEGIGLNAPMDVKLLRPGSQNVDEIEADGPTSNAIPTVVTLTMEPRTLLKGMLQWPDGSPLKDQEIQLTHRLTRGKVFHFLKQSARTQDDGSMVVEYLNKEFQPPERREFYLIAFDTDGARMSSLVEVPQQLPHQTIDLGKIRLQPSPKLIGGHIVNDADEPVDARISLQIQVEYGDGNSQWRSLDGLKAQSGKDGYFEIFGETDVSILHRLRIHAPGLGTVVEDLMLEGQDRRWVLERRTTLHGSVQFDPLLNYSHFRLRFKNGDEWEPTALFPSKDGEARFWTSVRPDQPLELEILTNREQLVYSSGLIAIQAGEANRPEFLQPLDLREKLRAIKVAVLDPEGNPLKAKLYIQSDLGWMVRECQEEGLILPAVDGVPELQVRSDGYQTVRLNGLTEDRVFRMARARQIPLRIPLELMSIPEIQVKVLAHRDLEIKGEITGYHPDFDSAYCDPVGADGSSAFYPGEDGNYTLSLMVRRGSQGPWDRLRGSYLQASVSEALDGLTFEVDLSELNFNQ